MDLLGRLLTGGLQASSWPVDDDRWFAPIAGGGVSVSGQRVDGDTARKLSAWFRGRDILATVLAMLPLQLLERLPDRGGSEVAYGNPLYGVLHDQPNRWQDSFQWRRQAMFHLIDHGNAYARIVPGRRGFVDQLEPLVSTDVAPEQIKAGEFKGRILYHVRDPRTGMTETLTQDQVFHLRGASDDGIVGKGILAYARDNLGIALATESYAGRLFSQGSLHGGTITVPGVLDDDASRRMAESFTTAQRQWHLPRVLEQGATFAEPKHSAEDSQMLLSRKHSVDDVARWLGLPRMMLENNDPSFGNATQFDKNFITYHMGGWLALWEFAIKGQLILNPARFYAEFTRDAFERGDLAARWTAHVAAVNAGIKSVDEVRAVENLNKRGGQADELRVPANITGKPAAATSGGPVQTSAHSAAVAAMAIATAAAARLLRKETAAVQRLAVRFADDGDGFAAAVTTFYHGHVALVLATLPTLTPERAEAYCAGQASQVVNGDWIAAIESWGSEHYAAGVAALALEQEAA